MSFEPAPAHTQDRTRWHRCCSSKHVACHSCRENTALALLTLALPLRTIETNCLLVSARRIKKPTESNVQSALGWLDRHLQTIVRFCKKSTYTTEISRVLRLLARVGLRTKGRVAHANFVACGAGKVEHKLVHKHPVSLPVLSEEVGSTSPCINNCQRQTAICG